VSPLDLDALERKYLPNPEVSAILAEVRRLRGYLCYAHEDCRAHPSMAYACSIQSPPRVGDLAIWVADINKHWSDGAAIVKEIDESGRVYAPWRKGEGLGWVDMRLVRVIRRAGAPPSNSEEVKP
jgi:hypothetical protein